MRKVFLTGGAGFIGHHLIPILLERGIEVTVYDNLSTGRKEDIEPFIGKPGFAFVPCDLLDWPNVALHMAGHDVVWHLGANTLIPPGSSNFRLDLDNNVLGTFNILEAMRLLNIKRILFASTAATYGDEPGKRLSEGHGPMRPISLYGASKMACEGFISAYSNLFGIQATIFRFSNVIGGGMGHGVIYDLIQKLRKYETHIPVWGDGQGQKPYMLVEDCIAGMFAAYNIPADERPLCDIYNLGCSTFTKVSEVAEIVRDEMGKPDAEIRYEGGRHGFPGDVPFVHYDASKMDAYGWRITRHSTQAVREAARRLIAGQP